MDSWLTEVITVTAPSAAKIVMSVYDKLKGMKDDEADRAILILFLAQIIEQNNVMNRKLDSANEALAILLKRSEKTFN
ncbi:MAG: hypothetical protein MRT15_04315 [archaeon YNP-LCB-003-016]|uniref:hypothetical protein n=1 Tax=Candidatus Culexarchaeum yellowstonense TaxID=2928963 RepID=UPI0026EB9CCA|nr:hypothetical protein [Candidatus Culexarchaeum yellowstonense]MCR6691593.1 hypothetical protein [Candidatus Culexarchaeum yellowstonense]